MIHCRASQMIHIRRIPLQKSISPNLAYTNFLQQSEQSSRRQKEKTEKQIKFKKETYNQVKMRIYSKVPNHTHRQKKQTD